jgi:hypothetical protein
MTPIIDGTVSRLNERRFLPDPIAGSNFSRTVSVMSSAYKRHGHIIETAILHQLQRCPRFEVSTDPEFQVSANADLVAGGALKDPSSILGNHINYDSGPRKLQVDVIVYDRESHSIRAYEIKRGFGLHDAGKKRSILRDTLCLNMLLKSYGEKRGLQIVSSAAHVVFYYGTRSVPPPFSLIGTELDEHFEYPVYAAIEEINDLFRSRLFSILSR